MNDYVAGMAWAAVLAALVIVWAVAGWVPAAALVGLGLLAAIAVYVGRIARRTPVR